MYYSVAGHRPFATGKWASIQLCVSWVNENAGQHPLVELACIEDGNRGSPFLSLKRRALRGWNVASSSKGGQTDPEDRRSQHPDRRCSSQLDTDRSPSSEDTNPIV